MVIRHRKAFTLLEILAAMVIVAIVASASVAVWNGYQDRAAMLVDETNQRVLHAAIKSYAFDNDALPTQLTQLRETDLKRAFASVTEGAKPYTFWAYLKESIFGVAYAQNRPLPPRYYGYSGPVFMGLRRVLQCPRDEAEDRRFERSYRIPENAQGRPLEWLLNPANAGENLIEEFAGNQGTEFRHGFLRNTMVVTTVEGRAGRKTKKHDHD